MIHSKILIISALLLIMWSGFQHNTTTVNPQSAPLVANGLYLILNEYTEATYATKNGVIIPYSHDFLDENKKGQPLLLEIDTSAFVRLELAQQPEEVVQPDERINLLLTLSGAAKKDLADFTSKNLNGKVAIVIGGKAVTMHKVREKIDSGKLQISRCTDNACEYLLLELNKDFEK